jgi:alpha-ribazole phosphatase
MAEIYLIRHTTPAVEKGICYGQTDLDVTESFEEEAAGIRECLPDGFASVYSSPLRRCSMLAERLFPGTSLLLREQLMEIHCGEWEMRGWDQLPREAIDPWMADFVNIRIPGGESYIDLHNRVSRCWEEIVAVAGSEPIAVVAHGGVIRSILAGLTGTPLIDSFKVFALHYACVVRIRDGSGGLVHTVLANRAPAEKEQHKPSRFYNKPQL